MSFTDIENVLLAENNLIKNFALFFQFANYTYNNFFLSFSGRNVTIPGEVIVLNSIVLPHKDLSQSYKNEIIL